MSEIFADLRYLGFAFSLGTLSLPLLVSSLKSYPLVTYATLAVGGITLVLQFLLFKPSPSSGPFFGEIAALYIHPVKSCAPLRVTSAQATTEGILGDRMFAVIKADTGRFITQRQQPKMALIVPTIDKKGNMNLRAPGMEPLTLALQASATEKVLQVSIWRHRVEGLDVGDEAAQWFSEYLGVEVRLARYDDALSKRMALDDPNYTHTVGERNSGRNINFRFADSGPIHFTFTTSLEALNERLRVNEEEEVSMARFRPNVVISPLSVSSKRLLKENGEDCVNPRGFYEDSLEAIDITSVCDGHLSETVHGNVTHAASRCNMTTVDPTVGEKTTKEPLVTLGEFRDPRQLCNTGSANINETDVKKIHGTGPIFGLKVCLADSVNLVEGSLVRYSTVA